MKAARITGGAPHTVLLAIFLGGLAALPPVSIDMALPALVDIAGDLHATSSQAGLTLSLFMAGFVVGPLAYGPLSDAYGRRPLLLVGLAIFTGGGALASLAPSIGVLLLARFAQGLGAGAGTTLALAIVRDRFEGQAMQERIASITAVASVAPIVAPSIGVLLLPAIHWRGIYGVMGACGLTAAIATWSWLRESANVAQRRFSLARLVQDYATVLNHRKVMGAIAVNGLAFGWMFAYVSGSPFVLLELLHVRPAIYAAMFATTGAGIVAGAALNGAFAARGVSGRRLLVGATGLAGIAAATLVILELLGRVSVISVMPLLVTSTFSFGLAAPSAARGALDPLHELAGAAGGLLTSVQMLFGAVTSSLVVMLLPHLGMLAMSGVMAACAVLAMLALRLLSD